ncbi:hypothetical protein AVEN_178427-1 [Araneus ventricosus]|uniref:Uncharacterized protein n=1 Tax=Araneus ventricosus TaxID=182803 RepID=A0A4Y2BF74_ARAVE|nr:hypothetical protein AVEN_178427-1 [Araneus ventricosus]
MGGNAQVRNLGNKNTEFSLRGGAMDNLILFMQCLYRPFVLVQWIRIYSVLNVTFREVFAATVVANKGLPDSSKFSYLIGAIRGPTKLLSGFSMSGKCYKEAWATLSNRYDNRRNLAYALLSKFINVKPIKLNNPKSVFEVPDNCNLVIRNLKTLRFEFKMNLPT